MIDADIYYCISFDLSISLYFHLSIYPLQLVINFFFVWDEIFSFQYFVQYLVFYLNCIVLWSLTFFNSYFKLNFYDVLTLIYGYSEELKISTILDVWYIGYLTHDEFEKKVSCERHDFVNDVKFIYSIFLFLQLIFWLTVTLRQKFVNVIYFYLFLAWLKLFSFDVQWLAVLFIFLFEYYSLNAITAQFYDLFVNFILFLLALALPLSMAYLGNFSI